MSPTCPRSAKIYTHERTPTYKALTPRVHASVIPDDSRLSHRLGAKVDRHDRVTTADLDWV